MHHVIDDDVTTRVPVRKAHQLHATAAHLRGELTLSGATANPADGAVLVLQGDSSNSPLISRQPIRTW